MWQINHLILETCSSLPQKSTSEKHIRGPCSQPLWGAIYRGALTTRAVTLTFLRDSSILQKVPHCQSLPKGKVLQERRHSLLLFLQMRLPDIKWLPAWIKGPNMPSNVAFFRHIGSHQSISMYYLHRIMDRQHTTTRYESYLQWKFILVKETRKLHGILATTQKSGLLDQLKTEQGSRSDRRKGHCHTDGSQTLHFSTNSSAVPPNTITAVYWHSEAEV